jgi:hypothetical protein
MNNPNYKEDLGFPIDENTSRESAKDTYEPFSFTESTHPLIKIANPNPNSKH